MASSVNIGRPRGPAYNQEAKDVHVSAPTSQRRNAVPSRGVSQSRPSYMDRHVHGWVGRSSDEQWKGMGREKGGGGSAPAIAVRDQPRARMGEQLRWARVET